MPTPFIEILTQQEQASSLLNPIRSDILAALRNAPASAAGLSEKLGKPRQLLNYHLRELEDQGLVELESEHRKRNFFERILRLKADYWLIGSEALGNLAPKPIDINDRFSAAYLVALAAKIISDIGRLLGRAGREGKRLSTMTLDAEIRFADAASRSKFAEELSLTVAELIRRYDSPGTSHGRDFKIIVGVYPDADKTILKEK